MPFVLLVNYIPGSRCSRIFLDAKQNFSSSHIKYKVSLIEITPLHAFPSEPLWILRWYTVEPRHGPVKCGQDHRIERGRYNIGNQFVNIVNLTLFCYVGLSQQTQSIDPMLDEYWPAVSDLGPTFTQHWVDVSCLLGSDLFCKHLINKSYTGDSDILAGCLLFLFDTYFYTFFLVINQNVNNSDAKWSKYKSRLFHFGKVKYLENNILKITY